MLKWHIMVAHGKATPVIVRVPGPNVVVEGARPWGTWIKHALDSNADQKTFRDPGPKGRSRVRDRSKTGTRRLTVTRVLSLSEPVRHGSPIDD